MDEFKESEKLETDFSEEILLSELFSPVMTSYLKDRGITTHSDFCKVSWPLLQEKLEECFNLETVGRAYNIYSFRLPTESGYTLGIDRNLITRSSSSDYVSALASLYSADISHKNADEVNDLISDVAEIIENECNEACKRNEDYKKSLENIPEILNTISARLEQMKELNMLETKAERLLAEIQQTLVQILVTDSRATQKSQDQDQDKTPNKGL